MQSTLHYLLLLLVTAALLLRCVRNSVTPKKDHINLPMHCVAEAMLHVCLCCSGTTAAAAAATAATGAAAAAGTVKHSFTSASLTDSCL
jgi:hypothetical protein